jgi:hypothetical protein
VLEARSRYPDIEFHQGNVEDEAILREGKFDLVFCFGLLYHLENPLLAIRHLRALTKGGLLLESMCIPDPSVSMVLLNEPRFENQSLTDVAFYPSENCLVKMLYRAGFRAVYRLAVLPDHEEFRETPELKRRRTVLFASVEPVGSALLLPIAEPNEPRSPWRARGSDFFRCPPVQSILRLACERGECFPECRYRFHCHSVGGFWRGTTTWAGPSCTAGSS